MGTKHALLLDKGPQGFGFGLSSRDVLTDDHSQPIYIKSITSGGAAFVDGRLRIGDRLLSVDGVEVTGMRQGEVAGLLRAASGQVRLVVSRHAPTSEEEEEEEVGCSTMLIVTCSAVLPYMFMYMYIVHGFRPKTDGADFGKQGYHRKEHFKSSRMAQNSAS